ncbi:unnamed protein product [Gongylonema pulchrum]|uniref:F-box domain-containing protein n=1 Tax=Gongylonema pulchrum TaxID=637853 RepID=A0A3P7QHQ4_9BILA|nr:unnamed protein product [Gongylonema pulchrum]
MNYLDQCLKEVDIHGTLSFSGITLDSELYYRLCKKWVTIGKPAGLSFMLCDFRLPSEHFRELLRRIHCQRLVIELSRFEQFHLDDLILEAMPECEELVVNCISPMYCPGITDRTLHRWAIQERPPRKIFLNDIQADFTVDGITTLINVRLFVE